MSGQLGRLLPPDFEHLDKWPVRAVADEAAAPPPGSVEIVLPIPQLRTSVAYMDQGREGACVGAACCWGQTLVNSTATDLRLYDFQGLYRHAQAIDGIPGENYSGTTVRAGLESMRTRGLGRVVNGRRHAPDLREGIQAYRWATTPEEVRACLASRIPVIGGFDWFRGYDEPELIDGEPWCCPRRQRSSQRGGHCIMLAGWSDRREAALLVNSWAWRWGQVRCFRAWWPIPELAWQLANRNGECAIVTDR